MGLGPGQEGKGSKDALGTKNCMVTAQIKITNRQIKSVNTFDIIKVFYLDDGTARRRVAAPLQMPRVNGFAANPTTSAELEKPFHQKLSLPSLLTAHSTFADPRVFPQGAASTHVGTLMAGAPAWWALSRYNFPPLTPLDPMSQWLL